MCSPGPAVYSNVFKRLKELKSDPGVVQGSVAPSYAQGQPQAVQGSNDVSGQFSNPMAVLGGALAVAKARGPGVYRMNISNNGNGRVIS